MPYTTHTAVHALFPLSQGSECCVAFNAELGVLENAFIVMVIVFDFKALVILAPFFLWSFDTFPISQAQSQRFITGICYQILLCDVIFVA